MSSPHKFYAAPEDGDVWHYAIRVRRFLQRCGLEEYKDFWLELPSFQEPSPAVSVSINNMALFYIARVAFGGK